MKTEWGIPGDTDEVSNSDIFLILKYLIVLFNLRAEQETTNRTGREGGSRAAVRALRNEVSIATCSRNVIPNVQAVRDTYVNEISYAYRPS